MRMWPELCFRYPQSAGINLMQIWIGLDWSTGSLIRRGLLPRALVWYQRRDFWKVKMEVGWWIRGWIERECGCDEGNNQHAGQSKKENTQWRCVIWGTKKGKRKRGRLMDMIAQRGFQKQRGREFSETPDWAANHSQPRNDSRTTESLLLWKRHHCRHCFNPWKPVKLTWGSGSHLMLLCSQHNAVPAL